MSGLDDLLGGMLGGGRGGATGGTAGGGLGGMLGGGRGGMMAMLLPMLAGLLANGGLERVLGGLRAKGKEEKVDSWVSTGPNEPLSADEARDAIGDDEVERIAERLGVPKQEAADAIAEVLPDLVDRVTPEGRMPPADDLDGLFGKLRDREPVRPEGA